MWHSCGTFDLEHHFEGKSPEVREVYDALVAAMKSEVGAFEVVPQKTRICFMTDTRFANCRTLKSGLVVNIGLPYVVDDPRVRKAEHAGSNWIVHEVKLNGMEDIDEKLLRWIMASRELMGDRKRFDQVKK